jgi:hypothetical protein
MSTSNSSNDGPSWRKELEALCESAIEGQLTEATRDRIESLVASDPAARQFYVDYLHQHACLSWAAGKPQSLWPTSASQMRLAGAADGPPPAGTITPETAAPRATSRLRRWVRFGTFFLSAAAVLLIGLWLGGVMTGKETPNIVATLTSTKAAKWSGGTLPTADGTHLTPGSLHLAEGVARLTFGRGAEVSLEGPAELHLVSVDKCVLVSGRLVANVPPPAIGFIVETQAAMLKDLGTEFGVSVRDPDSVDVAVFDGLVDVQERSSGHTSRIKEGNSARVLAKQVTVYPTASEMPPPPSDTSPITAVDTTRRVVQVSDALGRGKDAFVLSSGPPDLEHTTPGLLQVKNVLQTDSLYQRKAYICFDLAPVSGEEILEARLDLTLMPTAFSSRFPDATFAVYGMTDDALDSWDEQTIDWDNAPANGPGGAGVDTSKAVLLGRFVVEQGIQQGTFGINGDVLRQFLQRDHNGLATMIIVRETGRAEEKSIIHGFASRRHPTAAPPTLKLVLRASSGK